MAGKKDLLPRFTGGVVLVGFLGWAAVYLAPLSDGGRYGAFLGVAAATFSGLLALVVKRWALEERESAEEALKASLKALAAVFGVRVVMVGAGLIALSGKGSEVGYTVGFLSAYFALQWIEISYVLAEQDRRQGRRE